MRNRVVCAGVCLGLWSAAFCGVLGAAPAADDPQGAGSPSRNNVSNVTHLPVEWNVGQFEPKTGEWLPASAKGIRWVARLGSQTYGTPVAAGGKVFCATNNGAGWLDQYPASVDLGCLLCFTESGGRFLWQLSRKKLAGGDAVDFPQVGICCSPLVEPAKNRLWLVTNRCEVVCAEIDPAKPGSRQPEVLWSFDIMRELGVVPHNMTCCSLTAAGDLLLVSTSNGVDKLHKTVPAPNAPSFIALDKNSGRLVWADGSPGANIVHGQWSSPAFAVIGGVGQAIFAGGDGWVYSFRVDSTAAAGDLPSKAPRLRRGDAPPGPPAPGSAAPPRPTLLWKFDCNPKTSVWKDGGQGDRATLVATPLIHADRVYIGTGDDPEFGEGPGHLWCIDASKRGDVSPELVLDRSGKPLPPRRLQAANPAAGDVVRPNPNSAAVWHYTGRAAAAAPAPPDAPPADFKQTMHRTLSTAVIKDDLLVIADLSGLVHCLDARSGRVHWTYDMLSAVWGSPLVADGKVYLGDEDGDVVVFALSPTLKILAKNNMGAAIYTTPVAADGMLFVATRTHLVAVGPEK
jgi:outer membrane protein assembly factor BamB